MRRIYYWWLAAHAALLLGVWLLFGGCAPPMHPDQWEPYDPSEEWACEKEAWSRSMWAWIDDRYIDRDLWEECMVAKGFTRR